MKLTNEQRSDLIKAANGFASGIESTIMAALARIDELEADVAALRAMLEEREFDGACNFDGAGCDHYCSDCDTFRPLRDEPPVNHAPDCAYVALLSRTAP